MVVKGMCAIVSGKADGGNVRNIGDSILIFMLERTTE